MGEEDEREEEKLLQLKCCFLLQSPAVLAPTVRSLGELGIGKPPRRSPSLAGSQKTPASEWRYQCSRIGPGLRSYIHMRLQRLCCSLARSLPFFPFASAAAAACWMLPAAAPPPPPPPPADASFLLRSGAAKRLGTVGYCAQIILLSILLSLLCGPPKRA